jgi:hypothetical protein
MKKIPKLIDRNGMQIKMPKNREELAALLTKASSEERRQIEDHVLYLQGRPSRMYSDINKFVSNGAAQEVSPINGRQDIVKALADLGAANAKIAYSLMRALEGSR